MKRKSYWAAKVELTARIEEAQADGDQDRLSQLREDLQNLEFDHVRYTAARDSRLSQTRDINRRNRQLQIEREHQYMQKRNQEEASGTAVSDAFQRRQYVSRKIEAAAPPATAAIAKTASDGGARQEQEGPLQKTNGMAAPSIGDLFADHAAMEIDIAVPDSGSIFLIFHWRWRWLVFFVHSSTSFRRPFQPGAYTWDAPEYGPGGSGGTSAYP